jgi:hypothetical protein
LNKVSRFISLLAVTALVIPAAAIAEKPSDPGAQGKSKAQERSAKSKRCKKRPNVGYTATGTLVGTPSAPDADGNVTLTVNVTKTNKHASALKGDGQVITVKAAAVKYEGNEVADDGDRVKIVGKVAKPKKKCPAATDEVLERNIRKVMITEPEPAEEQQPVPPAS